MVGPVRASLCPCACEWESGWDQGGGSLQKPLFFEAGEAAAAIDGLRSLVLSSLPKGGPYLPRTYEKSSCHGSQILVPGRVSLCISKKYNKLFFLPSALFGFHGGLCLYKNVGLIVADKCLCSFSWDRWATGGGGGSGCEGGGDICKYVKGQWKFTENALEPFKWEGEMIFYKWCADLWRQ